MFFDPSTIAAQGENHQKDFSFEYAAKIVCGLQKDPDNMRLARGFYASAINIYNPNHAAVGFSKTLALTFPPDEQRPGEVMPISSDRLGPHEALEVDCVDIQRRLFPRGFRDGYIKGFVLIRSEASLDVSAVYSTAGIEGEYSHSSIDVEQISERRIRLTGLSDLIPVPDANGNFCRENSVVLVTVANQGTGPAGASKTEVLFWGSGVVTKDTPGLGPGDSIDIPFDVLKGCFNPDCHFTIKVDRQDQVTESNEGNNIADGTCIG
jgi:hypothetical protein